jgi:hypothetical protein
MADYSAGSSPLDKRMLRLEQDVHALRSALLITVTDVMPVILVIPTPRLSFYPASDPPGVDAGAPRAPSLRCLSSLCVRRRELSVPYIR